MLDSFRTLPLYAVEDGPRIKLPSGRVVTSLPLADSKAPLLEVPSLASSFFMRARLTRVDAIVALSRLGLTLPSRETILEIARVGLWIPPTQLVYDSMTAAKMRTREFCERHDRACWEHIVATGGIASARFQAAAVMNFGKWHCAGAADRNNRLCGWQSKPGAALTQAGLRDNHPGEAESLFDYGTLTIGEEP